MVDTRIIAGALPPMDDDDDRRNDGAQLVFWGRVRDEEHGKPIVALEYEHYADMAEQELRKLAERTVERFSIHDICCLHRVGEVAVGHASMRVEIWSKHRADGLAAMAWFISELKEQVPIWKWALTADGERFASHCKH